MKLLEPPNKWVQQLLIIEESLRTGVGGTPAKVASDHSCNHVTHVLHVSVRAIRSIFFSIQRAQVRELPAKWHVTKLALVQA